MKPTYALPEPKLVWQRFFELFVCRGHRRKNRRRLIFLDSWAKGLGFQTNRDAVGNLAVHVPATGASKSEPVVLQCHVDIVAVTASGETGGADATKGLIPTVRGDLDPTNSKRLKDNPNGDWILGAFYYVGR